MQGDRYATIHVTPEPDYSYASFETNLDFTTPSAVEEGPKSMPELVEKVLAIFLPAKLSITLFVSMDDEEVAEEEEMGRAGAVGKKDGNSRGKAHAGMKELLNADLLEKYSLVDRIIYEFVRNCYMMLRVMLMFYDVARLDTRWSMLCTSNYRSAGNAICNFFVFPRRSARSIRRAKTRGVRS